MLRANGTYNQETLCVKIDNSHYYTLLAYFAYLLSWKVMAENEVLTLSIIQHEFAASLPGARPA